MTRGRITILLSLPAVSFACLLGAQDEPWNRHDWGAKESTEIMFHPARQIQFRGSEIDFVATKLQYKVHSKTGRWEVAATEAGGQQFEGLGKVIEEIQSQIGRFEFSASEGGVLDVRGATCGDEPRRLRLWTAADLGRVWLKDMQQRMGPRPKNAEELSKRMTVAEPKVLAWQEDKLSVWLGIGFYAGEGSGGVGTILQLRKCNCTIKVHHPPPLGIASVMYMARRGNDLWLGTGHFGEGSWGKSLGLVRYNTRTGVVAVLPKVHPLADVALTAMARQGSTLWMATPGRFFAFNMDTRALRSWRIVPRLEMQTLKPVSSRPGGPARAKLQAGNYEVRWLGPKFAEILTPDCQTGFAEKDWVGDPNIKGTPDWDEVGDSTYWGNPLTLRTYPEPIDLRSPPQPQGWFLRVNATAAGPPLGNWQRARVCAGWVEAQPEDVRLFVEEIR